MAKALLSVYDKTGLVEFARGLVDLGWELIASGGTARLLAGNGLQVTEVADYTHSPELLGGRVKTLHPAIHGGILAQDTPQDRATLDERGWSAIDLVVVNLYPFVETIAKSGVSEAEAIEQIDIGGPSMLRSAAKNHAAVLPIVDPADYPRVLAALDADAIPGSLRRELAAKVFTHTSVYDAAIGAYLAGTDGDALPPFLSLALTRQMTLRYGENPYQRAALYVSDEPGVRDLRQLHGKELSFNNILDIEGALLAIAPWSDRPACAIIKHTTPCGIG